MVESVGRIFVALGLPPEVRRFVSDAADAAHLPGRRVGDADLHITLRFLGEVGEVDYDRLLKELDEQTWPAAYSLRLTSLGAFPNARSATVAWVGVEESQPLLETHARVEDACAAAGLGREERPFRPHVTLARIRPPADLRSLLVRSDHFEASFPVTRIAVLRSQLGGSGPRYEPLDFIDL